MACKVCGVPGASFCTPCRSKYGGAILVRLPTAHRSAHKAPRRATSSASAPRRRKKQSGPLSREEFLRRMARGRAKAARKRAAAARRPR